DGDKLAVLPRNGAVLALGDVVQPEPGLEVGRRQRAHVAQQLGVARVVIVVGHYLPTMCGTSLLFSSQMLSISSQSGCSVHDSCTFHGFVYALGSSIVTSISMLP